MSNLTAGLKFVAKNNITVGEAAILAIIAEDDRKFSYMEKNIAMNPKTLYSFMRSLLAKGVVIKKRKEGRAVIYSINPERL